MFERSDVLRSPHAFSTRRGGVSAKEHTKWLNLAFDRGDGDGTVLKNLDAFAKAVGFDAKNVISLPQIHSDRILLVTAERCGQGYFVREGLESADGYVTAERGVVLGIKTADCVPVLLEAEKDGKTVAVGAVHAGWRGTVADIAGKCVDRLCSEFGVEPRDVRAAIGPCIHACCYEVSRDVYEGVASLLGEPAADRLVAPSGRGDGKYYCDLVGINKEVLLGRGLARHNIGVIDQCTSCLPDKYYSHRYSGGVRGTMLSVIFME